MGVSHIALAVKDMRATHDFYTDVMGFNLVKVEVAPKENGFRRHAFYSTGSATDQLIAFWDLAGDPDATDFKTDICRDLGLDWGTNHIAFQADGPQDIERHKLVWIDHGLTVVEIDHGWVHSIYTDDPDGITVEFAYLTQEFTEADATEALELLFAESPEPSEDEPKISFHVPDEETQH